jgi:hypothetical protein
LRSTPDPGSSVQRIGEWAERWSPQISDPMIRFSAALRKMSPTYTLLYDWNNLYLA